MQTIPPSKFLHRFILQRTRYCRRIKKSSIAPIRYETTFALDQFIVKGNKISLFKSYLLIGPFTGHNYDHREQRKGVYRVIVQLYWDQCPSGNPIRKWKRCSIPLWRPDREQDIPYECTISTVRNKSISTNFLIAFSSSVMRLSQLQRQQSYMQADEERMVTAKQTRTNWHHYILKIARVLGGRQCST